MYAKKVAFKSHGFKGIKGLIGVPTKGSLTPQTSSLHMGMKKWISVVVPVQSH